VGQWARALQAYLPTAEVELAYWQGVAAARPGLDVPAHTFGQVQEVGVSLSEVETAALLTETHQAYTTEINDLLLAAFGRAWHKWRGESQLLLTLEGHGREPIAETIDLSRTVGWFTCMYPFALQTAGQEVGADIKQVKESLRRVPTKGLGYGILRYLGNRPGLAVQPAVSFNYLGQFDDNQSQQKGFVFAPEPAGEMISPEVVRPHALDVNGLVAGGRLQMSISYGVGQFTAGEVQHLAELFKAQLVEVITHCQQKESSEKTVSDFTLRGLSEEDFGNILDALG
jgi:non-ribosomal peptide synthase protein (TIGR01720 family)